MGTCDSLVKYHVLGKRKEEEASISHRLCFWPSINRIIPE